MVKRAEALRTAFSARLRKEAENSQKAETLLINRLCFYDEKLEFDNLKKAATPRIYRSSFFVVWLNLFFFFFFLLTIDIVGASPALAKAAVPRPGTPQTPQSPTSRPISSPGPTYAKAPLTKAVPPSVSLNSPQPQLVMNSPVVGVVGKQPPSYAVNVVSMTPTAALAPVSTISVLPTSGNVSTLHSTIPPASSASSHQASPLGGGMMQM